MDFLTLLDGETFINMRRKIDLYGQLPYMEPEFIEAWREWIEYRISLGKPYKTQKGINKQLNMFIKNQLTVQQAIECIDHAIQIEWTGIFPLNFYKNGLSSRTTIGDSVNAATEAFANLQRNIDQTIYSDGNENWSN